jgi:sec-independent protein translocase protein TatA
MPMLGPWELIVVLLIVVVIFGAGRLSEVGGAVGKSIKEFRRATTDEHTAPSAQPTAVAPAPPVAPLAATSVTTAGPAAAAPTPVVVENKCPSCATINPNTQAFCGQCGARLTRAA